MPSEVSGASKAFGPYDKGDDGYAVVFEYPSGGRTTRIYSTISGAKNAISRVKNNSSSVSGAARDLEIPEPDGTVKWWLGLLEAMAKRVAEGGDKEARSDLKSIASAAASYKQLYDNSELERKLDLIEEHDRNMDRARRNNIGIAGSKGGLGVV